MSELPHAKSYRELIVYQKARQLARDVFEMTKAFPREEMYSLTDQIRYSSRSVGAQIAEAWAKRRYEKSFVTKLVDADAEQMETQHWVGIAFDCGYLNREQATVLKTKCEEIGRILAGMISKAESFCNPEALTVREEQVEYFTTAEN
ncbi:MAG: four helix bundle protein [Anaerolineales bacterium]|nr:four helix bundle protein [Anaerolineales bacterium]